MSIDTSTPERSRDFAKTVIPLMKEFGQKVEAIGKEGLRIRHQIDEADRLGQREASFLRQMYYTNWRRLEAITPAVNQLARHVSQQIEHGDLDDLTRLELQLRLAEFEDNVRATHELLNTAVPQ